MSKLAVCGDSYWSPTNKLPKSHFSEIICNELNYDLLPLARSGSSNSIICLQLQKAINESADLIIFGCTFETRITISKTYLPFVLENTYSDYPNDLARKFSKFKAYTSASLSDNNTPDFSKKHFLVNENYETLSTQQSWMISYWIEQVKQNGIKFLFSPYQLVKRNSSANQVFDQYRTNNIGDIPYIYEDFDNDPGYHTHPDSQKLIADQILSKYKECYL